MSSSAEDQLFTVSSNGSRGARVELRLTQHTLRYRALNQTAWKEVHVEDVIGVATGTSDFTVQAYPLRGGGCCRYRDLPLSHQPPVS